MRAVDLYAQSTPDLVHFERAANENRVLLSNDHGMEVIAEEWLADGRSFRGLILWPQELYRRMTYGEIVDQIGALREPFPYKVIHIVPRR